jgi:hypothetical protein
MINTIVNIQRTLGTNGSLDIAETYFGGDEIIMVFAKKCEMRDAAICAKQNADFSNGLSVNAGTGGFPTFAAPTASLRCASDTQITSTNRIAVTRIKPTSLAVLTYLCVPRSRSSVCESRKITRA